MELAHEFSSLENVSTTLHRLRDLDLLCFDLLPHVPEVIGAPHQVIIHEIDAVDALVGGSRSDVFHKVRKHAVMRNPFKVIVPCLTSGTASDRGEPGEVIQGGPCWSTGLQAGRHRRPGSFDE